MYNRELAPVGDTWCESKLARAKLGVKEANCELDGQSLELKPDLVYLANIFSFEIGLIQHLLDGVDKFRQNLEKNTFE